MGWVVGDSNPEAGAWIRFNPLDGKGVKNENVTDFKYALVESDNLSIEKQNAIMRELELPIATLVYSGSKSIHAIVKVDAQNYSEYQKRVEYLYKICIRMVAMLMAKTKTHQDFQDAWYCSRRT